MARALVRLLKWIAFGWAAATLLGAAFLAMLVFMPVHDDAQAGEPMDRASADRRQVQSELTAAGLGAQPLLALEAHQCAGWGGVDARWVRVAPGVPDPAVPQDWHRGDQLPPHASRAIERAARVLQSTPVDWVPSVGALTSSGYRVLVRQVTFAGDNLDGLDLVLLRPETGSVYLLRGNSLAPPGRDAAPATPVATCGEGG